MKANTTPPLFTIPFRMQVSSVLTCIFFSLMVHISTAHHGYALNCEIPSMEGDTVFGAFTEVTPNDPLFITPADEDFWVNATAPADFDNDGDLDIAVIGYYVVYNGGAEYKLVLMRNEGQAGPNEWDFSYIDVALGPMYSGSSDLAWGDADGDGDLDLLAGSNDLTFLYLNESGTLINSNTLLPGYWEDNSQAEFDLRSISWADFDNDGDQDLMIPSVYDSQTYSFRTALMRNNGADSSGFLSFTETAPVIDETSHAQTAWADYDADQDLDLLVVNIAPIYDNSYIRLYKNEGNGAFTPEDILGTLAVVYGEAQWGDYDGDGDLDILIAGGVEETNGSYTHMVVRIYLNNNGAYVPIEVVANPAAEGWIDISAATWADYDSDGDLDILVAGNYNSGNYIEGRARIYSNTGGVFSDSGTELPAPRASGDLGGTFSWMDMDGDGDLDYFISGQYFVAGGNGLVESQMHLYRNDSPGSNLAPSSPTGLLADVDDTDNSVKLSWSPGNDDHTPVSALTYDLELFKDNTPVNLPFRTPEPGKVSAVNEWTLGDLPNGEYKWVLRAVDASFTGSPVSIGEFSIGVTTHVDFQQATSFNLGQNFPNPFSNATCIHFSLPTESQVILKVYNMLGVEVALPVQEIMKPGEHEIQFNASSLPDGVYFYCLETGGLSDTRKMVVKRD